MFLSLLPKQRIGQPERLSLSYANKEIENSCTKGLQVVSRDSYTFGVENLTSVSLNVVSDAGFSKLTTLLFNIVSKIAGVFI